MTVTRQLLMAYGGAAADPYWSSVKLLLNCNGTNGSTTLTDSSTSAHSPTLYADAQISTAQSKYGGASLAFDGSGDYVTVPNSADFSFPGDFTVEFWMRVAGAGDHADQHVIQTRDGVANGFLFQYNRTNKTLAFASDTGGLGGLTSGSNAITDATWHHIAVARASASIRHFIDGTQVGSTVTSSQNFNAQNLILSRRYANDGFWHYFNGHLDDIRITKGVARYTANFSAPASEFTA